MVVTLSILVTRIATVALTYTGLSRESAKFQARSAFTGVGFTTHESEKVVNHPIRRRILLMLMLLGNAGVITAVSSLIISFVNTSQSNALYWKIFLLVTGVLLLWLLANSKIVDRHLSQLISIFLNRYTRLNVQDYAKLLHLAGDYQVIELYVKQGDWLVGRMLGELKLPDEGVIVLGVNRPNGDYLGIPDGSTELRHGDILIVYGHADRIDSIDRRHSGVSGNIEHRQKVEATERVKRQEKQQDEKR